MKSITISIVILMFSIEVAATMHFKPNILGDHYVYFPEAKAENLLVIAHGMYGENQSVTDVALKFAKRWTKYAEQHNLIMIIPVFDDARFGTLSQGYGGYRNLFGKFIPADKFVNNLVDEYSKLTSHNSNAFYLYGHSAGAQFTVRYSVTHPYRIIKAVASGAGRYSYPNKEVKWPYGAGDMTKTINWDGGNIVHTVNVSKRIIDYAYAAEKVEIVIGAKDSKSQPVRPGHIGTNRIEFAQSWSAAMNSLAKSYGKKGNVSVNIVPEVGHNSKKLTPFCAEVLFDKH
jgi:hypothetical protein